MTCDEAQELITALVDQELRGSERTSLEAHLQECAGCRLAFDQERVLKEEIRAAGHRMVAPVQLRDRILGNPQIFPKAARVSRRWQETIWPKTSISRAALVAAIVLMIVLPTLYLSIDHNNGSVAVAALEAQDLFANGDLPMISGKSPDEIKKHLIAAVGGRFQPMGYDLTAMNLWPVAGAVREMQGRKILIAIYQGQGGSLFCYTFLGSDRDAPPGAARFFDSEKGMNLYAFSHGKINAVLHREGDVICILASEMPMEDLVALAKSKARPS